MKTKRIPFDIELAKAGARVVTRCGYPVRLSDFNVKNKDGYTLLGIIDIKGNEVPFSFLKNGCRSGTETQSEYDLFIEEEVEEEEKKVEEADDYNPYKETVKSISDMIERYPEEIDLQDFYDNVKVKCKDAFEYDKKWCKKQDEKPADNKPKFKKGDWVTDIDKPGVVHQITDVIKNVTNHTYDYNAVSFTYGFFGYSYFSEKVKSMRLWDINDAKDGDVLVCIGKYGQEIGIVKKYVGKYGGCDKCFETYCFVDWEGIFRLGEYIGSKEIYPATKEQCELLFQKIKEAGYEWNSDKKELHKIEKVKTRRMTNQELSWWLHDHPEEHREMTYSNEDNYVSSDLSYLKSEANIQVYEKIVIRKNGGEWEEPLIDIK